MVKSFVTFRRIFCFAALLAVAAFLAADRQIAFAQLLYGTLLGNVKDASGGVVVGASVTILDPSTGLTQQTTTSDRGEYTFGNLAIGTYDVTISQAGFKQFIRRQVSVPPA